MTTTRVPTRHGCGHARRDGALPGWALGWAYAACAIPLLGFTAPDALWVVGMPLDLLARGAQAAWQAPGPAFAGAVVLLPAVGALLTPVVAARTEWTAARRRAAAAGLRRGRLLPLIAVAAAVMAAVYGLIGSAQVARDLVTTAATWSQLRAGWAEAGAAAAVLAWAISLGGAAVGHRVAARPRCALCGGDVDRSGGPATG